MYVPYHTYLPCMVYTRNYCCCLLASKVESVPDIVHSLRENSYGYLDHLRTRTLLVYMYQGITRNTRRRRVAAPRRAPGGPPEVVFFQHSVVFVVFTLNRSFYPTTSAVPPVSFLILHPTLGEIQIMWSQTVRQRKTKR